MYTNAFERTSTIAMSDDCLQSTVGLLIDIVGTACEHESDVSLLDLVNLMDLYRSFLADNIASNRTQTFTSTPRLHVSHHASFEQFIGDPQLLQLAAATASRETGVEVPVPSPLKSSTGKHVNRTSNALRKRPSHGDTAVCADIFG